ncbi:MAG: tetratricopeptide repeat protein [Desulfatibacillum sp.]|nr:tetratricopeptide repeat protein [Desulfatibacillum sp.]
MANTKRISRKDLLNEPDEFITMTGKVVRWCRENEKQLYTAGVIGCLVIVILAGWSFFANRAENKASSLFSSTQAKYATLLNQSDAKEAALATAQEFKNLAQEYPRTDAGRLANAMAGQTAFDSGDYDGAIEWWEKALKALSTDPLEKSRVLLGLGYAYEQKADYDNAEKTFTQVLDMKMGLGKEDASLALARIYETTGDAQKSIQAYEKFVADFPDSAYAQLAKEKLAASAD